MLAPVLMLQLAILPPRMPVYASPALRDFLDTAAATNHEPPPLLRGYRARVESELSLLIRDTLGRERSAQIEQIALNANWIRGREYDLRVIGYRSQSVGVPYSALSLARGWTVPHLYGDRLTLGVDFGDFGASGGKRPPVHSSTHDSTSPRAVTDTIRAVHPLAADRDRFYRFSGGDTVAVLHSGKRDIPIVRVHVTPVLDSAARVARIAAFEGEIDFDGTRHQIVRMRGRFVATPRRRGRLSLSRLPGVVAVAYVELVNAEVGGRYWLPAFQRSEFQATFTPLGTQRSVFRLVSQFHDLEVVEAPASEQTTLAGSPVAAGGSSDLRPHLTYAPEDSVSGYRDWTNPLGESTAQVKSSDFDDLAPDQWRASGAPRLEMAPTRLGEVFRFNRVEGAYTGFAARERFRDLAPGLSAHVYGGWAWTEATLRGGASAAYSRGSTTLAARAERLLASTNDFTPPLEDGAEGFGALGGYDDQDYVDRRVAAVSLTRYVGPSRNALLVLEGGPGSDRPETTRLDRSPIGGGQFRVNRWSMPGHYLRGAATIEIRPDVTGLYLEPGLGLIASYQGAAGNLSWQRAELTVAGRENFSDFVVSSRAQGGVAWAKTLPPQQLFEIGGENALPGYGYKQFAGDRAAIMGVLAAYTFPVLRRPWRIVRNIMVPGLSPGIAAGIQGGWAEASSAAARTATTLLNPYATLGCLSLGTCPASLSTPTGGIRATVDVRLTFFGGLIGIGVARPIDRAAPWRLAFRLGQAY